MVGGKTSKPERDSEETVDRFFQTSEMGKNLKTRSVRGGTATVTAQFLKLVLRVGSTAILARMLTPQDYGLVAMTAVVTGFAHLFSEAGLSLATIQKEDIGHKQVSTLFWINVALGCLICLALIVVSPAVAALYGEEKVRGITCGLALAFVFGGLTVQHRALLVRQMRFKDLAIIDMLSMIVSIATAIIMAYLGYRYWSLVGMGLSGAITTMLAVWVAVPWRPGVLRRKSGVGPMLRFGGDIIWFNIVNYFSRHLDNLLIGKYWGAVPLGFYSKAYTLLLYPISQINAPLGAVVIPGLSRLNTNREKFKRYFLVVYELVSSLVTPIIVGIALFADHIVALWLGPRWLDCAPLFRYLGVAALLGALSTPIGWLLVSAGNTRRYRNLGMVTAGLVVMGFLSGLGFGAEGVALGYSAAMVPATIIAWIFGLRGTNIELGDVLKAVAYPGCASAISALVAVLVGALAAPRGSAVTAAAFGALAFSFVYVFVLLVLFRKWTFFLNIAKAWREPTGSLASAIS
jgi:O-antigen/teichoic acid export membrane protein